MADSKITALAALTGANLATGDAFPMVDVSDTSMDATGTNKKMSAAELAAGIAALGGLLNGAAGTTGCLVASYDRRWCPVVVTNGAATSGTLRMFLIPLPAGLVISNLTFWAGTTAGASLTHSWAAIFDASRNKVAISADNTGATWTASTSRTFAVSYTVPTTGAYYYGLLIAGTTIPTIEGTNGASGQATTGARNAAPITGGNADSGLSTPATCPTTAAAISILGQFHYCEIS